MGSTHSFLSGEKPSNQKIVQIVGQPAKIRNMFFTQTSLRNTHNKNTSALHCVLLLKNLNYENSSAFNRRVIFDVRKFFRVQQSHLFCKDLTHSEYYWTESVCG